MVDHCRQTGAFHGQQDIRDMKFFQSACADDDVRLGVQMIGVMKRVSA